MLQLFNHLLEAQSASQPILEHAVFYHMLLLAAHHMVFMPPTRDHQFEARSAPLVAGHHLCYLQPIRHMACMSYAPDHLVEARTAPLRVGSSHLFTTRYT